MTGHFCCHRAVEVAQEGEVGDPSLIDVTRLVQRLQILVSDIQTLYWTEILLFVSWQTKRFKEEPRKTKQPVVESQSSGSPAQSASE